MKDEIISFGTAKLAKERGFNQRTDNWYRDTHKGIFGRNYQRGGLISPVKQGANRYLAPTQSLLQRWLRDVHGIKVIVDTDVTLMWLYTIQSLHPNASYTGIFLIKSERFETYEQALEAGLFEALKLMKLC